MQKGILTQEINAVLTQAVDLAQNKKAAEAEAALKAAAYSSPTILPRTA